MDCLVITLPTTYLYRKGENISTKGTLFDDNLSAFTVAGTIVNITNSVNGGMIYELDATPLVGKKLKLQNATGSGANTDKQCVVTSGKIQGLDVNLNGVLQSFAVVDLVEEDGSLVFTVANGAKYIYFRDNTDSQSPVHDYIQVSLYADEDIED